MNRFSLPIQVRWADIDANRHLRHSVYYDYGASLRMAILSSKGLTTTKLEELGIGPVLFREEAVFKREILFEDMITVDVALFKATSDFSRWSIRHNFVKANGVVAAILTVEGAWIDMAKRKLAMPGPFIQDIFRDFPKAETFEEIVLERKG
jgi:acyl-CoA thioester hydrolase